MSGAGRRARIVLLTAGPPDEDRARLYELARGLRPEWTWTVHNTRAWATSPAHACVRAFLASRTAADILLAETGCRRAVHWAARLAQALGARRVLLGPPTPLDGMAHPRNPDQSWRWRIRAHRSAVHSLVPTEQHRWTLLSAGISDLRITPLNFAADIDAERQRAASAASEREPARRALGWEGRRVLLHLAEWPGADERLRELASALRVQSADWLVAAAVPAQWENSFRASGDAGGAVQWLAAPADAAQRARLFNAADACLEPWLAGSHCIRALCHGRPVVAWQHPANRYHSIYLGPHNALILPPGHGAAADAAALGAAWDKLPRGEAAAATVAHLTMETAAARLVRALERAMQVPNE